ncbi:MAG: ATP-binding protein [Candidatus Cloacimonetes bacterium]|nr:ATP-binding protein [Candidatus Cloacimonadota bacterium]
MKFYGRSAEIDKIRRYWNHVKTGISKILVITGRRRIGKTRLVLEATSDIPHLYFFVTRKKVTELLRDWSAQVKGTLGDIFFGEFRDMEDFLNFLFDYSKQNPISVIFDEFQNFSYTNPEVYSIFQKVYDLKKDDSALLLIISGSSHSLMEKIFKGTKEPLFGRASEIINLSYLSLTDQAHFLKDQGITSQKEKLFFFSIFDGVPKYWEEIDFYKEKLFSNRLKKLFMEKDWIWEEGENILREEFGKDYVSYFSILSAIAKGRRILSEIEQFAGIKEASAYLKKLENIYQLIERKTPVTEKSRIGSRKGRYYLRDNFFTFWFAFVESRRYLKEIGQKEQAIKGLLSNLEQFSGRMLEKMAIRTIIEENPLKIKFTRIGNYWDRKGEIEVDVIVLNDNTKDAYLFEVKRNKQKITSSVMEKLRTKAAKIPEIAAYRIYTGSVYPDNGELVFELEE